MRAKDAVGRYGEDIAVARLKATGWHIIARNWRSSQGEIDVIAQDGQTLVVVEVKTRSTMNFGHPAQAVTQTKLARLRRLTAQWLNEQDIRFDQVRIDIVAVVLNESGQPEIDHLIGVS